VICQMIRIECLVIVFLTRCSRRRQTSPLVPPPGEHIKTYAFSHSAHSLLCENMMTDAIHKTCRTASEEERATATSTENLVKFRHVVFETCERKHRQTKDRHTNTLITIRRTPTGSKVMNQF